jgi:hypothetical protein
MSTSAPGRVKTILVVDLTHMLNDPFATTILADLRARLIPPTAVRSKGPGYSLERASSSRGLAPSIGNECANAISEREADQQPNCEDC